jgi:hypothetical protein
MNFKHSLSSSFILTLGTGKLHIDVLYITADGGLADDSVNTNLFFF